MGWIWVCVQRIRCRMRLDRFRELGRQYPVFCFLLLVLLLATLLLNRFSTHTRTHAHRCPSWVFWESILKHILVYFGRYIHIIMVFWSFLAGVVTFYCSLGPESLLPNIFGSIKPKTKVGRYRTAGQHNNDRMSKASNKLTYLLCLVVVPAGTVSSGPQLCRLWKNQMQKTQVRHLLFHDAVMHSRTGYGTMVGFREKHFHIFPHFYQKKIYFWQIY